MAHITQENCQLFFQICKLYHSQANTLLNQIELYRGQEMILGCLWQQEGLTHSELADKLNVQPATVSNALNSMEKNGFIERRRDDEDHRVYRVYLTDAGQALQQPVTGVWQQLEQCAFHNISITEQEQLNVVLKKLYQNLQDF